MSSRCQCPFSGPSDTILGCHRDPITSEKGWLDFAVRELSRVAAGKARGQEAVWRSQCKPQWWDSVCPHPWKNPTANPKDSKDTLKAKFECLVQHLRKVGQLPREMQKEIDLWEADQKAEVFVMTFLSSLLGQTSNLHSLVEDTCHRMEESSICVDFPIVNDLQRCLTACVNKLGSIRSLANERNRGESTPRATARHSRGKRLHCETGSPSNDLSHPPSKQPRCSPPQASPPLSSSSTPQPPAPSLVRSPALPLSSAPQPLLTPSPPQVCEASSLSADRSRMLLAALQNHLLHKQSAETASIAAATSRSAGQRAARTQALTAGPKARPCHSVSKRGKGGKKKTGVLGVVEASVSVTPAAEAVVVVPPSACLPAALQSPHDSAPAPEVVDPVTAENAAAAAEFPDFLELDLSEDSDDDSSDCQLLNDYQFLDSLLREPPSDVSANVSGTAASPCSAVMTQPVPSQSPASPGTSVVHDEVEKRPSHDPFFGHSLAQSGLSEISPFHFNVSEEAATAAAAGRQAEGGQTEGCTGTALYPGVGDVDRGQRDTDTVSDSGYHSESSAGTSHRSSLDSETAEIVHYSDLDSPDLEAYLASLDV